MVMTMGEEMATRFKKAKSSVRTWKTEEEWGAILKDIAALPVDVSHEYIGKDGSPHSIRQGVSKRRAVIEKKGLKVRMALREGKLYIKDTNGLTTRSDRFKKEGKK
jgi:hypothetical protein